jgi:hypothetical protein
MRRTWNARLDSLIILDRESQGNHGGRRGRGVNDAGSDTCVYSFARVDLTPFFLGGRF